MLFDLPVWGWPAVPTGQLAYFSRDPPRARRRGRITSVVVGPALSAKRQDAIEGLDWACWDLNRTLQRIEKNYRIT
jgi:hypothetical protein